MTQHNISENLTILVIILLSLGVPQKLNIKQIKIKKDVVYHNKGSLIVCRERENMGTGWCRSNTVCVNCTERTYIVVNIFYYYFVHAA